MRFLGIPGLLCGIALLSPPLVAAQTVTTDRDDYPSSAGARGITTADFNRDGWLDFATANEGPHGVAVLLNGGRNGGFSHSFIPLPGGPFDLAAADLNKDGIPDIAVANADAHQIDLLFGSAGGGFSAATAIPAQWNPRAITVADMNNDGNPDLVFTLFQSNTVQVLHGDGRGAFAARTAAVPVGPQPQGVVAVDMNLDGRKDLAIANNGSTSMTILHQQANGSFSRSDLVGYHTLNVLATADFNNDGKPDVAAASTRSSVVDIYLGGAGIVRYSVTVPTGADPRGIAAADINQDGKPDLITGNRYSSTVSVLVGTGEGTFTAGTEFAAGSGSRAVAAADFDNDSRIDIASGNENGTSVTVLTNSTSLVRAGFAFSQQTLGTNSNTYSGGSTIAIADFDHDGRADFLTHGARQILRLFLGNGRQVELALERAVGDLEAADVNGDGHADIIAQLPGATLNSGDGVWILPGDGTGQFGSGVGSATSISGSQFVVTDFNGDGKRDLLAYGRSLADYQRGEVQPLVGRGDGTFTSLVPYGVAGSLAGVEVSDVNRDGKLDFIVGYNHPARIGIYRGQGDGNFGLFGTISLSQWSSFTSMVVGDVNLDGFADILGTSAVYTPGASAPFDFQLAVIAGGAGGFAEPVYARGPEFFGSHGGTRLIDLNLDGRLDLMTGVGDLLLGNGDGTFAEPHGFALAHSLDLKFGDFNNDGLPDMAHARSYGEVSLILNRRQATNSSPTADAGADRTYKYEDQFGEEDLYIPASGTDADLHRLTYQWYGPDGQPAETGPYGHLEWRSRPPGTYTFTLRADDGRGGVDEDSLLITILPLKEIVVHLRDGWAREQWQMVADGSAASGMRAYDQNLGRPKVTTPVANPQSFAMVGFIADPTQEYKLWVRLKAEGNHWANDSLWLQFNGAADAAGNPIAPWGTTTGIEVNLEECSGCGISGWGWRDEAWGQPGAIGVLTLRFPKGGWQAIQIQTREDGVSIDQIVLSAETYRTTRPGAVKNDATILPRTIFW